MHDDDDDDNGGFTFWFICIQQIINDIAILHLVRKENYARKLN